MFKEPFNRQNARLIICETSGMWALALRRALGKLRIRVFETRSRQECLEELFKWPASFVGLEWTVRDAENVYKLLARMSSGFPTARAVVFGERGLEPFEYQIREVGAIHVTFSPRRVTTVARLAQRHLEAIASRELSLHDTILSRLPWSD